MAGGFVIGGSIFLLLSVFDTFTNLNSVEMREQVTKVLSSPTGEGLGISVGQALAVMRVGLMVTAACAAAAAVLGVYVLQRNRGARLALSILAVPILLTAPLTGGLVGALVAAATLMLWSGPARDWFAGRPVRQVERPGRSERPGSPESRGPWESTMPPPADRLHAPDQHADRHPDEQQAPTGENAPAGEGAPHASSLSTAGPSTEPVATSGFGQRPGGTPVHPGAAWMPPAGTPGFGPVPGQPGSGSVPATVKLACALTWVFSGLVALMYAAMLVILVVAQDQIVDYVVKSPEWKRANLQQDVLVPVLWVGCLMFLVWALGACVLAFFTWRRHNWARWMLAASAATAFVAALFAFPFGVLHQLAAVLTVVGLFNAAARAWFTPSSWTPGPPPGSQWGQPQSGDHPAGPRQDQSPSESPSESISQSPGQSPGQSQGQPPTPGGKPPVW